MDTNFIFIFLTIISLGSMAGQAGAEMDMNLQECAETQNSYLWKIDTTPPIFLFGTMHVPYTYLWEFIPENVKTAFSSSQELCLELELLDRDTASDLYHCRLLPRRTVLEDLLSEDLISRITNYLDTIKELLPKWMGHTSGGSFLLGERPSSEELFTRFVGDWRALRPVWILYLLHSLTEENAQLNQVPVVDTFLERGAHTLGKGVQAIENPNDQCRPFNKLGDHEMELALSVQMDYLESLVDTSTSYNGPESNLEDDINTYRCGDFSYRVNHTPILPIPSLDDINVTSPNLTENDLSMLKGAESTLHRQLVVKRNRKMARQIEALLESEREKVFFLGLGAGHYLSEKNSVLARLRRKGYVIHHIPAQQQINGSSLPDNFVQLGDPSSVTGVMHIKKNPTEETSSQQVNLAPHRLEEIFNRLLGNSQTSTSPSDKQSRSKIPTPGPGMVEADMRQDSVDLANWLSTSSAMSHLSSHTHHIMLALLSFLVFLFF